MKEKNSQLHFHIRFSSRKSLKSFHAYIAGTGNKEKIIFKWIQSNNWTFFSQLSNLTRHHPSWILLISWCFNTSFSSRLVMNFDCLWEHFPMLHIYNKKKEKKGEKRNLGNKIFSVDRLLCCHLLIFRSTFLSSVHPLMLSKQWREKKDAKNIDTQSIWNVT